MTDIVPTGVLYVESELVQVPLTRQYLLAQRQYHWIIRLADEDTNHITVILRSKRTYDLSMYALEAGREYLRDHVTPYAMATVDEELLQEAGMK